MLQSISHEVLCFYDFLKHPKQNIFKQNLNLQNFISILLSYYVVFLVGIIFLSILAPIAGLDSMPHKLQDLQNMNKWALVLLAVITQPFLEELFFRYPLKYTRGVLALLCTMAGMILYLIFSKFGLDQEIGAVSLDVVIAIIFVLILFIFLWIYTNGDQGMAKCNRFVTKYFPHFFYAVAVYFAFIHFFNFETEGTQWIFTPIMVLPQFIIALFVGYTRLKYGFLSAVVIHMINNLIPMLFILQISPS